MARSAKIYDFTIPANGSFTLLVEGSYYRILSSSGALEVKRDGGSGVGPIYAGQGERDEEFKRLTLVDKSGAANNGYIIVSDGTFVDDRITGEVSVTDGSKAISFSGIAFVGAGYLTANAAELPHIQLLNPSGNTKNIILKNVQVSTNTAGVLTFGRLNTVLTINTGWSANKNVGSGLAQTAQVRQQSMAGNGLNSYFGWLTTAANTTQTVFSKESFILPPGQGFGVISNTAASLLTANFEWTEEAI